MHCWTPSPAPLCSFLYEVSIRCTNLKMFLIHNSNRHWQVTEIRPVRRQAGRQKVCSTHLVVPWPPWTADRPAWWEWCPWGHTSSSDPATGAAARWGAERRRSRAWACSSHPQRQSGGTATKHHYCCEKGSLLCWWQMLEINLMQTCYSNRTSHWKNANETNPTIVRKYARLRWTELGQSRHPLKASVSAVRLTNERKTYTRNINPLPALLLSDSPLNLNQLAWPTPSIFRRLSTH